MDIYNRATVTRAGMNIVQSLVNNSSGTDAGTDAINAAPLLAPLGNYGGPTLTMALMPGSPARNAAVGSTSTSDQRGYPIVGTPDLGAYEAGTLNNFNAFIYETLPATATIEQHLTTADFDGDGMSNADEFAAGTNPADATSVLRIFSLMQNADGTLSLGFPSVTGRSYTLAQADALTGPWTGSGGPTLTGNGGNRIFTVVAPAAAVRARFYRVVVTP